jgi:hypothetical protein
VLSLAIAQPNDVDTVSLFTHLWHINVPIPWHKGYATIFWQGKFSQEKWMERGKGTEAHRKFRRMLGIKEREEFPYEFDGFKEGVAYELDWGSGGNEIYKDFFEVLCYKVAVGKQVKKLVYFVRENYPDEVFNGFRYASREAERIKPILLSRGIDIEIVAVKRLVRESRAHLLANYQFKINHG